jgi:hypothetical protein
MSDPDVSDIARRHGVSTAAAEVVLRSLCANNGTAAQFDHPDLGGFGQWMPGMVQVGDMFNATLRARVDALCAELAAHVLANPAGASSSGGRSAPPAPSPGDTWWPAALGSPDAAGGQNDVAYAWFAASRRLAIRRDGRVTLHDTGDHRITGVAQAQGSGVPGRLGFTTPGGTIDVASLARVSQ